MIFVVLGTQKFQLNRLLKLMDEYVEIGKIKEEVIAQRGNSDYVPKNFRSFDFLDKNTFDSYIKKADIVVTHSGVGSIITSLKSRKPVIVFPRLRKYGEHVDALGPDDSEVIVLGGELERGRDAGDDRSDVISLPELLGYVVGVTG